MGKHHLEATVGITSGTLKTKYNATNFGLEAAQVSAQLGLTAMKIHERRAIKRGREVSAAKGKWRTGLKVALVLSLAGRIFMKYQNLELTKDRIHALLNEAGLPASRVLAEAPNMTFCGCRASPARVRAGSHAIVRVQKRAHL